ncbi:MAG TPA: hypothetical protein VEY67_03170 [Candidatus Dormibacteraeota bacterium]|nr:hypothetical protein [Candidatus Dormibacteraeota bacterium]
MTDEPPDRPEPSSEPFELTSAEVELIVEALRYLESTLGREEAAQLGQVQAMLAKLGAPPSVGVDRPTL